MPKQIPPPESSYRTFYSPVLSHVDVPLCLSPSSQALDCSPGRPDTRMVAFSGRMKSYRPALLSPPFTPPQSAQRLPSPAQGHAVQQVMFRALIIQQLSPVLGEPVTGIELLRTNALYHLIRVRLSDGRALLVKSFLHHGSCREALTAAVESCLQDGEDVTLTLPYDHVRRAAEERQWSLEHVRRERLILLAPASGLRKLSPSDSPIRPLQECLLWGDDLMAEVLEAWAAPAYALTPAPEDNYAPSPGPTTQSTTLLL
jgi:hypothetical protein